MLTPYELELIHREVDGANTPEESSELRKLVETDPEALSIMTSLQGLDAVLSQVPDRAPRSHVIEQIRNAIPSNYMASSTRRAQGTTQTITGWITQRWNSVTNFMEESMETKKILIIATTAVAAIAVIGQLVTGYSPSIFDAGTIGARDGMSGVTQAGRVKGRKMSADDVTLSNPQISALFQDDKVLKLVKSDVFREAMRDEQFRELQSSEAYHQLMKSDAYHQLMNSEAYNQLMNSEAYNQLMKSEAYNQLMKSEAYHQLMKSESYNQLMKSDAYNQLMKDEAYNQLMSSVAFQEVMKNDAYREAMKNDAYREAMKNDAFRDVMKNDAYREVMKNDAYHQLQSNEVFRELSRDQSLSELFLSEAMRAEEQ
ncbi:MAG TPA: hypothetical protein VM939_04035 [Gemmatimonadaceae bacterium]|nr:hypothetical protein [Gemmatimonadaceae bacterium]